MSRIRRAAVASLLGAIGAGAVLAPAAFAAGSTATPVKASAALSLHGTYAVRGEAVTVPHRPLSVAGIVRPFAPGQKVTVRSYLGSRLFKTDVLRVRPAANGRYGTFTERLKAPGAGLLTVRVGHSRTAAMRGFLSVRRFRSLAPTAGYGSRGTFVELIQQRLARLHVYVPQTGVYDAGTGWAIDAYHRLLGWGTSPRLDGRTVSYLLNGWGQFAVRFPGHGRHAEGDLSHQLLALIDGSSVQYIFPISSGKPSTPTILGDFHVYQRTPGYLPDGMYYSSFFIRGYAIHGYDPAPDYPASHGCMRLPIADAITAYNWLNYGDWVDTYYR